MVLAYLITKTVNEAKTDRALAEKGIVSPRLQAKYGDQAKAKTDRYGLVDFLADAWSDNWANRTEARRTAREAAKTTAPAPGKAKVSWWQRLKAAQRAVSAAGRKLIDPVPHRQPVADTPEPVGPAPQKPDVRHCPDCGQPLTHTDGRWRHPDGKRCRETGRPYGQPANPEPASTQKPERPRPVDTPTPEPAPHPTRKGVPAVSGEAVNYETTVAELEALIADLRLWLEACIAALAKVEEAKNHITDMQASYRSAAGRAAGILEHLAAMHLDATTLAHIGAIADALPASKVDQMLASLEEAEELLKAARDNAADALAAAEAALAHIVAEYGEEAAKVAQNLGGDSTFLASGGGAAGRAAAWDRVSAGRAEPDLSLREELAEIRRLDREIRAAGHTPN